MNLDEGLLYQINKQINRVKKRRDKHASSNVQLYNYDDDYLKRLQKLKDDFIRKLEEEN